MKHVTSIGYRRPRGKRLSGNPADRQFVVPAQAGTQGKRLKSLDSRSRERRAKGAKVGYAELDYSLESGGPGQPFNLAAPGFPLSRRAVRGKSCGGKRKEIGSRVFVLAGLDPAIHAFGRPKQRRGCADQVRARRLQVVSSESKPSYPCRGNFPGQPCRASGDPGASALTLVLRKDRAIADYDAQSTPVSTPGALS